LIAEKDPNQGGDPKRAPDKPLLISGELQHAHVAENFDLPSPPNGDLKDHHDEELKLDGRVGVHKGGRKRTGRTADYECGESSW
jgi:hypothetical protein